MERQHQIIRAFLMHIDQEKSKKNTGKNMLKRDKIIDKQGHQVK
jgi:hypothetical protein